MWRMINVRVKAYGPCTKARLRSLAYENNRSMIHKEKNLLLQNDMRPWSQTAMSTFYDICVSYVWKNLGAKKCQVSTITAPKILTINASRFWEKMKKPQEITLANKTLLTTWEEGHVCSVYQDGEWKSQEMRSDNVYHLLFYQKSEQQMTTWSRIYQCTCM